jgi:hypothetical protein
VFTGWTTIDGIRFPTYWEAMWHLSEVDLTYVKMNILSMKLDESLP